MATQEVLHAYRHLYRGLLHAVKFSVPARYVARDQLRRAFREPVTTSPASTSTTTRAPVLDQEAVKRTIWFLQAAAKERGLEHKVLKNLLTVAAFRDGKWVARKKTWKTVQLEMSQGKKQDGGREREEEVRQNYLHYDMTVAMLNKTMGLCLR